METTDSGKTRILLVDDEIRILETFSLMLSDHGYDVMTAANKDEALRMASANTFDIAFLDQFLGSARGLDLMKELAQMDSELSFVMMTANGSTDLAVEALKGGASDFITKPVFIADMIRSIEHVNTKRALETQKRELFAVLTKKVEEATEELNRIHLSVLTSLAQAMEKKDVGTFGHSKRVNQHAMAIADALGLNKKQREELQVAAMLHDIGKIGITDFILGKEGPLNSEEKEVIKSHPQKGYEILKPIKQFGPVLTAILHHHEQYDGSGYPSGLQGNDIPFYARIISVADTYDAILSTRPYRAGSGHEHAITELVEFSGRQFDPEIVHAFVAAECERRSRENGGGLESAELSPAGSICVTMTVGESPAGPAAETQGLEC